jgi:hypothetical protein
MFETSDHFAIRVTCLAPLGRRGMVLDSRGFAALHSWLPCLASIGAKSILPDVFDLFPVFLKRASGMKVGRIIKVVAFLALLFRLA